MAVAYVGVLLMADDPLPESEVIRDQDGDTDRKPKRNTAADHKWHETRMRWFDAQATPQTEVRSNALISRRFIHVPGAMWEGSELGEQFENVPKPEVDMITEAYEKVETDHRENRVMVEFLPDTDGDEETADTLNGSFRADTVHFGSDEAFDNAFQEAAQGGMGAWRLTTDYANPDDPDDETQRVNPGMMIPEADQRVFFGPSNRYDKADAPWVCVLTPYMRGDAEDRWPESIPAWPMLAKLHWDWDWYQPDLVWVAEWYEKEEVQDNRLIYTQEQSGEEQRFFESELSSDAKSELRKTGWTYRSRKAKRQRVFKKLLSGDCVLQDCGYIAGPNLPVVPVYGKRAIVNSVETFRGMVLKKMDAQRILNSAWSQVIEANSTSPQDTPILLDEQIDPVIAEEWASRNLDRKAYLRLKALRDEEGRLIASGQIGTLPAAQIKESTMLMLQAAQAVLGADSENVDEVKSNVSEDAMDLAASRRDARGAIYDDNFKLSMRRCGEVYLGMAREVYADQGRKLETRSVDGAIGEAELMAGSFTKGGVYSTVNDFTRGSYKVTADVQEATATKRQKTVRQDMAIAQVASGIQTPEAAKIASGALIHAIFNQDGENMAEWHDFARQLGLSAGLFKPTPEEQKEIEAAQQQKGQQPDPQMIALAAATQESQSKAKLNDATAADKQASAMLKTAQATAVGGPEKAPEVPSGLDAASNVVDMQERQASARLKEAQAAKISHEIGDQRIKTGHQIEMERRAADREDRNAAAE